MRKKRQTRVLGIATRAIHGVQLHPYQGPVAPPLVQTSTYRFANSHDAVRYAQGDPNVFVYTRYHNPTVRQAQEHLAEVMGAEKTLLLCRQCGSTSALLPWQDRRGHITPPH